MKKARLVFTTKCNRSCEGCCNDSIDWSKVTCAHGLKDLGKYEEVIITGGEPFLMYEHVIHLALTLKNMGKKVYLQTAWYPQTTSYRAEIFKIFDGITYTLHAELKTDDVQRVRSLAVDYLSMVPCDCNLRLNVDERIWDIFNMGGYWTKAFTEIRKMEWKDDCPLPAGEELVYWFEK